MNENQKVSATELAKIRKLQDFDLIMLISEIHDHGWKVAQETLRLMPPDPENDFKIIGEAFAHTLKKKL